MAHTKRIEEMRAKYARVFGVDASEVEVYINGDGDDPMVCVPARGDLPMWTLKDADAHDESGSS